MCRHNSGELLVDILARIILNAEKQTYRVITRFKYLIDVSSDK